MIHWANPDAHLYLLALLPISGWLLYALRRRTRKLKQAIHPSQWPTLIPAYSSQRIRGRHALRLLATTLLLLALARPQWGYEWEPVRQRGLHILVALDTSKSMLAADLKPNRLQQAKWGIRDLLNELNGDRIGLVAFAGDAFLQCPPTSDYAAFRMMLDDVYAGIVPIGGTDLYQALDCALTSFEQAQETQADNVIILISDGESHTGDPLTLLDPLTAANIRVFAIGVGTQQGELIQTPEGFVKNNQGEVVQTRLNETQLQTLARKTGGFYIRSAPGDFGLERIYQDGLSNLQRQENEERLSRIYTERYPLFLAAGLLLLLIEALIRPTRKEPTP
jgi:Ca-activated chloride channel family protein